MLKLRYKYELEAGCDEAGRGCLAGPVVAAAVILPPDFYSEELNDSKKLSEKQRYRLNEIIKKESLSYAISAVDHREIDEMNILNASIEAMHRAVNNLEIKPEFLLIDGNRFHSHKEIPHQTFVKGDGKWASIAAASILAKTHRDQLMKDLSEKYPQYLWYKNKGYPTKDHRQAIEEFGPSPYHRMSFKLTESQLNLFS